MSKLNRYAIALLVMLSVVYGINLTLSLTNVCSFDPWYAFRVIAFGTLYLIGLNMVVAFLAQLVPKRWINPDFWGYKVFGFEKAFYEKLGIKNWKDKVPELGGLFKKFSKSHIEDHSPEYFHHFIVETIYGEMTHTWAIVFGATIFIVYPNYIFNFALPLFLINFILNALPAMIQRYTRPKLCKVYKRMLEREEQKEIDVDADLVPHNQ